MGKFNSFQPHTFYHYTGILNFFQQLLQKLASSKLSCKHFKHIFIFCLLSFSWVFATSLNTSIVIAQIIDNNAGHKNITILQTTLQSGVIGYISPYHTVAAVTIHHHNASQTEEKFLLVGVSISKTKNEKTNIIIQNSKNTALYSSLYIFKALTNHTVIGIFLKSLNTLNTLVTLSIIKNSKENNTAKTIDIKNGTNDNKSIKLSGDLIKITLFFALKKRYK